ncbi:MAG: hypothetical protein ACXWR1_06015 [Bdellovibrionota bacterium]
MNAKMITLGLMAFSLPALADMDIPVGKVTAYSGQCKYDGNGGGRTASNGEVVRAHTVELAQAKARQTASFDPAAFDHRTYAIAAVPQRYSKTAGIYGCFFHDPQNFQNVTFKAVDHYGKGSNGLEKYDASHECMPGLNGMSRPATTIIVEGSCGGVRGGAGDEIPRRHIASKRKKRRG